MENYNSKYICSYIEIVDDSEGDDQYRIDLCNIFKMTEFNEYIINKSIHYLFEQINNNKRMMECMRRTASKLITEDCETGLLLLYSFDYLYLTHKCVSELLETGELSEINITLLENKI